MLTMFAHGALHRSSGGHAIVVVENVERIMSEEGLSPKEAPASHGPDHERPDWHRLVALACSAHGFLRRLEQASSTGSSP